MASPERFELPTLCLGGRCSIQLSYGDIAADSSRPQKHCNFRHFVSECNSGSFCIVAP